MEYGGKVLSRIVSVLQSIHGRKVPVEIVKYNVKERENGDVKYLERIEKITWKHPTFEKASLFIA